MRCLAWIVGGALLAPALVAAQVNSVPVLAPCGAGDFERPPASPVDCGWFPVAEDPTRPGGRGIRLRVVVVRSTGERPARDPIVRLTGGPGQGAASAAAGLASNHRRLFPERDLVLVDQRGTGQSNGLFCAEDVALTATAKQLVEEVFRTDAFRACRDSLSTGSDLSRYVTDLAADDLDAVLAWLGYDQVNLVGGSYGTRMAQVFLRRHPQRVRTVMLDGVVTMDAHSPVTYSPTATDALRKLVDACLAETICGAAYPDLRAASDTVWARLRRGPVRMTFTDPRTSSPDEAMVPVQVIGYAVRGMLYSPASFPDLPRFLMRARDGDYGPLVTEYLRRKASFSNRSFATGLYFSIFCSEDVPSITRPEEANAAGTIMDDALVANFRRICDGWPRARLPAGWEAPVTSSVPALLFSGEFDPVTTPAMAAAVAKHLPNSLHLVIPGAGHGSTSNPRGRTCAEGILQTFIRTGTPRGIDTGCVGQIERPPFRVTGDK